MKKLICLTLSLLMLLCAVSAHAELFLVDGTPVSFDPCGAELYGPDEEAWEEGVVVCLANAEETLDCWVYVLFDEGLTYELLAEEDAEDDSLTLFGTTTINGVELFYEMYTEDDEQYIEYYYIDEEEDMTVIFSFWYADDAAAQLSGTIMNTFTLAE